MILRLNRRSIRDLPTYLTDTRQATGYTCISHPFSWVISQLVTRRDWFRLIRILPYGVARLNRFHWCVVFLPPPPVPVCCKPLIPYANTYGPHTHTHTHTHTPEYTIWTSISATCALHEIQYVNFSCFVLYVGLVYRLVGWSTVCCLSSL